MKDDLNIERTPPRASTGLRADRKLALTIAESSMTLKTFLNG